MDVRLFRRNNKQSFSVQLSQTSGVVEVHCTSTIVDPPLEVDALERKLLRLGREEFGCLGGFSSLPEGGWQVQLTKLGTFDVKARGFVQCRIRFEKVAGGEDEEVSEKKVERQVPQQPILPRKKGMQWMMRIKHP